MTSSLFLRCKLATLFLLISAPIFPLSLICKGQWIWFDGSNTINTKNKVNITGGSKQYPGSRHGTTAWTDSIGNVWMYGGEGNSKLDELWTFNPKTTTWHFIGNGGKNRTWPIPCEECASCSHGYVAVLYGGLVKRKGMSIFHSWILNMTLKQWSKISTPSPPPREKSTYWCDRHNGLLWLYGGVNKNKDFGDMWQFSFKSMKWTEIQSNSTSNSPKQRFGSVSWFENDNLYLFGGQIPPNDLMSDLWVYNTTKKQWKLLFGSNDKHTQPGVYNHKGIPSNTSHPGCRSEVLSWGLRGALWLYGGKGCDMKTSNSSTIGLLSDLWMFNTSSNLWTWVGGSPLINKKPFYGKKKQSNPQNIPGPRAGSLTFRQGNRLWLFGGIGHDTNDVEGSLNDMWIFTDEHFGPPSNSGGLPGDTLDMPYAQRLIIAFAILIVAMIMSLFVCYRKECNIMYWRYKKRSPRVKYEPLKVKMQVPAV